VIDLDAAVAVLAKHVETWTSAGCRAGPITWRDAGAGWGAPYKTVRSDVLDPDSIGVRANWPGDREADVVLFRGGWADVDLFDGLAKVIVTGNPEIDSVAAFERLLESIPTRLDAIESGDLEANWTRSV
jgi:hypothetical protein